MRRTWEVGVRRGSILDPAGEKHLLNLHAAMDMDSFWKATQQLLAARIPSHVVGLILQPSPILPRIALWTSPMPDGFFAANPVRNYIARSKRKRIVRIVDLFSNPSSFAKSAFYRRYLAPQKCAHAVCLLFRDAGRLICAIIIMRTASQGDLSSAEMKVLRQLYPQFLTSLRRLRSLGRERSVRMGFEEFLRPLPLPTMLLRWNLKLIYQNRAARDFCNIWENGSERARLIKAAPSVPPEILDRCRQLKQQWARTQRDRRRRRISKPERVYHPNSPDFRATVRLKQLSPFGLALPHFLIECENITRQAAHPTVTADSRLPQLVRLTVREQEVAKLVCDGRSNQEIADAAGLSVQMVKKHLHAIFRKLEVPSRSRLITLMR